MNNFLSLIALVGTSQALVARDTGCCFHITANGGPGGVVDQLGDGQNRIGQSGLPEGQYCLNGNGGLTDSSGRGCIFTAPTGQWQCDAGATPDSGFSVGSDATISFKDNKKFYSCPTGQNGGFNIYDKPLANEPGCVEISLVADNCKSEAAPAPAPAPPTSACPADLPQGYEFPHLIIPIDSGHPGTCYGTSYNGSAYGDISSIFNFDIPPSAAGKTCKLKFLFPKQAQLVTSAYTYSGAGDFKFASLHGPANEQTTFASSPKVDQDFGTFKLAPGNAYDIASMACPAGTAVGIWLHALGDSVLDFFQDYNPCPIGLYITVG